MATSELHDRDTLSLDLIWGGGEESVMRGPLELAGSSQIFGGEIKTFFEGLKPFREVVSTKGFDPAGFITLVVEVVVIG